MSARGIPSPQRTEERVRQLATLDATGTATIKLPRRRVGQPAIVSRMIAAVPAVSTAIARDSFNRAIAANGWGQADLGGTWAIVIGTAANFRVTVASGGEFIGGGGEKVITLPGPLGDGNILLRINPNATSADAARVLARWASSTDGYFLRLSTAGGIGFPVIQVFRRLAGVDAAISGASAGGALAAPYFVRFALAGSTLSGTIWNPSVSVEPAPQVQAIDTTFPNPGLIGVGSAGANNMNFDDYVVTGSLSSPIWDAYINDTAQLLNLIDSSVTPVDRWIPQITNGQRLNPGEELIIVPRGGVSGTQIVVTCSFVYST